MWFIDGAKKGLIEDGSGRILKIVEESMATSSYLEIGEV